MEEEDTKPEPLRASATVHLGLNIIGSATARLSPKPKPPWQQFMDLNWNVLERLAGNPIVRWVVGSSIWTWLFDREREPAVAAQI